MRNSLYWDGFESRIPDTIGAIKMGVPPKIGRVAVHLTERCNFSCKYCNLEQSPRDMALKTWESIIEKYGDTAIIHVTGGEPSVVDWFYPWLETFGERYRIHLNTNAYLRPPAKKVRRLKVSLDSVNPRYWDTLVGRKGAWQTVVNNIFEATKLTVVSITYTMTKENYRDTIKFAQFIFHHCPDLYAIFFSVYKGIKGRFAFQKEDANIFFSEVLPKLKMELNVESIALIEETIEEKFRLIEGIRFPENKEDLPCYISMSERVISPLGEEFNCSHLYRDGIRTKEGQKHEKCLYGCNRRLIMFNEMVKNGLA